MALCGICPSPSLDNVERWCFVRNLPTRLIKPSSTHLNGKPSIAVRRKHSVIAASSSRKVTSPVGSEESPQAASLSVEEKSGHVTRFKMSDFKILDRVSVGHAARV